MKPLERIQGLPERKKKIILWTVLAVLAVILFYFLLTNFGAKLKNLNSKNIQKELNIPELEMPELKLPSIQ